MLVDTLRVLLRRWPVVLASVLAAAAAAVGVFVVVPPQQESKAQVLFLGPRVQAGIKGESNPFLALGGSLGIAASIVQIRVSDDDTATLLAAQGATAKYLVEANLGENAGPILIVTSDDDSAQRAQATTAAVVQQIQDTMRSLQLEAKAPTKSYITTTVLTSYPKPLPVYKQPIRFAIVAAGLVLVLPLALIVLVENRRERRSGRPSRQQRDAQPGDAQLGATQLGDARAGDRTAAGPGTLAAPQDLDDLSGVDPRGGDVPVQATGRRPERAPARASAHGG